MQLCRKVLGSIMKNDFSERDIDRILCDVPLPTLLLKAVSVEAIWSDEVLDRLMQHVEIPHDLHAYEEFIECEGDESSPQCRS